MGKRARLKRRKAQAATPVERGPISEDDAKKRARIRSLAGDGRGAFAFSARLRRSVKQRADFRDKAPKKRRVLKRGRR